QPRKSRPCTTAVSRGCRPQAYAPFPPTNSGERTRLACLVSASRRNRLSFKCDWECRVQLRGKVRDRETRSPARVDACAPQSFAFTLFGRWRRVARCSGAFARLVATHP